ncbi:tumor necrosis factor receptor superfamily member 5-like isoform X2 [Xyrauchen texanus]|uniref:tumor necrosis factor receptor superfamily member 5-like isoform X2 n=2 Tax=Xyrauchen texanus TaxID=154827 RepID=UPI002242B989|nr:tumor necrosis factor receptor superfamily member 5-like isoform X2 [Xyrauchen texanus]
MFNFRIILFISAIVTLDIELCFSACAPAEYDINGNCCSMCAPGNSVYWDCTEDTSTTCVPCPESTYIDEPNYIMKCFNCTVCDENVGLRVQKACTRTADTVCEPHEGFYCINQNKDSCTFAMKHSKCNPGQYIKQTGTALKDTVCADCTDGTYSNGSLTFCQPHSKCETEGSEEIKPGTKSSDAECGKSTPVGLIVGVIFAFIVIVLIVVAVGFLTILILKQRGQLSNRSIRTHRLYRSPFDVTLTSAPDSPSITRSHSPVF